MKHPLREDLSLIRNALTFSGTPIKEYRAPPLLGQNTEEVLKGKLGYSDAKLAELRKSGIIQQAEGTQAAAAPPLLAASAAAD